MKLLDNGLAVLEGDKWISQWVQDSGRLDHDQSFLPVILPLIKPGDWVVDAGAFIGDHTIAYLDKVGPVGKVWAFEINPEAYQCLKHNCPGALCFNVGLSNTHRNVGMNISDNKGASCINGIGEMIVTRLDNFFMPKLDFFKLDIEGHEVLALIGARETIQRTRPIICTEVNPGALKNQGHTVDDLFDLMKELGYKLDHVYPPNSIGSAQYDAIYTPL